MPLTDFQADSATLVTHGYSLENEIVQPGYIRAVVRRGDLATKLEWAQDSTWRFMPVQRSEDFGYQLHPIDLATNKVLTLAGREEPRDLLDTLDLHERLLHLGPLIWAAVGKDPGFSPQSLLELLRRRGKIRPEDLRRLFLAGPLDIQELKSAWLAALESAEAFIGSRPPGEAGCLYYDPASRLFVDPSVFPGPVLQHYGRPGGVIPRVSD